MDDFLHLKVEAFDANNIRFANGFGLSVEFINGHLIMVTCIGHFIFIQVGLIHVKKLEIRKNQKIRFTEREALF